MSGLLDLFRASQNGRRELPAQTGDDDAPTPESEQAHERELIENIQEIRDQPISELMVPRADIAAVEFDTDRDTLLRLLVEKSHSRLPVYRGTLDEVIGIVHIKDVLASIAGGG